MHSTNLCAYILTQKSKDRTNIIRSKILLLL
nr:MAG TPA: hypothetical protein [Bacteriophage sp.]